MSTFAVPERPVGEIISVLSKTGIAELTPDDIARPAADVLCSVYHSFLDFVDPLNDDTDGQISFAALDILENPDHHANSIRVLDLFHRLHRLLNSIHFTSFTLRDLLAPDPRRTHHILSNIVNFLFYRDDKMNLLQPIVDQFQDFDQTKTELESRNAELKKEIMDHDTAKQMEEPMVLELDAEVKELRQKIQNYNKNQALLRAVAAGLKEKIDAIDDKISKVDFEILQSGQENADLLANIVQSPDKLQKALEVKKLNRAEVKQSERSAQQRVEELTGTLEFYTKACEKMSKHLSKMQDIQEKINSAKSVDKDIKALKAALIDQDVENMKIDAKIAELQAKVKQNDDLIRTAEKEKDLRQTEYDKKFGALKAEMELKLNSLNTRERNIEATIAKAKAFSSEAESVREAGNLTIHKMEARCEEIVSAFHSYTNKINCHLQMEEENESMIY